MDIIIESEYDPLEPNTKAIDIMTNRLKDSTHVSQQKYEDENRMLGNDNSTSNSSNTMNNTSTDGNVTNSLTNIGNKKPKKNIFKTKTKEVLPIEQWASGKIEGIYCCYYLICFNDYAYIIYFFHMLFLRYSLWLICKVDDQKQDHRGQWQYRNQWQSK